jgi:hypothetical protein
VSLTNRRNSEEWQGQGQLDPSRTKRGDGRWVKEWEEMIRLWCAMSHRDQVWAFATCTGMAVETGSANSALNKKKKRMVE